MKVNDDIKAAIDTLKKGGIILYPTDTVWGIGCDATNADAVKKIYELKHRIDSKAMIVLVGSEAALERTVEDVPEVAWQLIECADQPVTIVYDKGIGLASNLTAPDGSIAVRITNEPFSQALCRTFRRPLVSTSANISAMPSPHSFAEISKEILEGVDYICQSRRNECSDSKPSMVIKISKDGLFKILRK